MKAILLGRLSVGAGLILLIGGCAVGPNYKRPGVDTPEQYRGSANGGTNSFADLGWPEVFGDPHLQAYIGEALTNNWDIKIAAARVLQAKASARVARSQFFPNVAVGGPANSPRPASTANRQ